MSKILDILKSFLSKVVTFFKKNDDVLSLIWKLGAICLVVAVILSATNLITADKIKQMEKATSDSAMASLIMADEYKKIDNSLLFQDEDTVFFEAKTAEGAIIGYIVETVAKGYGGDVKVMTAINTDKKIIAVNILSAADETPGLGQNATKPSFYEQFKGKTEGVAVVKNGADSDKNEVEALTGATVTSKAVKACIDEAFLALNKYIEISANSTVGEVQ